MLKASRLGILLLVVLLAGCTTMPTTDTGSEIPQDNRIHVESEATPEILSEESNLDDTEKPHSLTVNNTGSEEENISVTVTRENEGDPLFEQSYELESNAKVTSDLDSKANYTLTVERGEDTEIVSITRQSFDCNHRGTTISISESGLDSHTISTRMGCLEDIDIPEEVENESEVEYIADESNLGEDENPHGLTVTNGNENETSTVVVRIDRESETVFEQTYELAPDAEIHGVLDYKANYSVTVMEGDREATEDLQYTTFDCNSSNTTFNVSEEEIEPQTISTLAYCPPDPPK